MSARRVRVDMDLPTVGSITAATLAVLTVAIRSVLYLRMTAASERQQERIMRANPEQLEALKACQLPEPSRVARLFLALLLLAVTANGVTAAAAGYEARKFAAYNKCSECNADQRCVNGRCQATTAQPVVWALRMLPADYDYALGADDAPR